MQHETLSDEGEGGILRARTLTESLNSVTASSSANYKKSTVRFNHVDVREYAVTIGDNPSCSIGPPISLDWNYSHAYKEVPIDVFERCRNEERRHIDDLRMSDRIRKYILMETWNYPMTSIQKATEDTDLCRNQRMKTAKKFLRKLRNERILKSIYKPVTNSLGKLKRYLAHDRKHGHDITTNGLTDIASITSSEGGEDESERYRIDNDMIELSEQ